MRVVTMVMVTKEDSNFQNLRWVGLARGLDEFRPVLTHLNVTDNAMVCTNGHRLHIVRGKPGIEIGFYIFKKFGKTEIWLEKSDEKIMYPDYERALGKPDIKKAISVSSNVESAFADITRLMKKGSLDHHYLDDILSADVTFKINFKGDEEPIHFFSGKDTINKYEAVLMPRAKSR